MQKLIIDGVEHGACVSYRQVRNNRFCGWCFKLCNIFIMIPFENIKFFSSACNLEIITIGGETK